MYVQRVVDDAFEALGAYTKKWMDGRVGNVVRFGLIISPITFLPTVWQAMSASNIDALRTVTWPLLLCTNICACLSLAQKGDWMMRLMQTIWVVLMFMMWIITIVR